VVARKGAYEQTGELVADCLAEAEQSRWVAMLDAVQASAVLEDEVEPAGRVRRGGVHRAPVIGPRSAPGDPSPE
jgi:hypothetical protein